MSRVLKLTTGARRAIRELPPTVQREIAEAVQLLEHDPFPVWQDAIRLRNSNTDCRLRIDPYRIIYRVTPSAVTILRVEKRSGKTYRGYNPEKATAAAAVRVRVQRTGGPIQG